MGSPEKPCSTFRHAGFIGSEFLDQFDPKGRPAGRF
jgi:hypothetical protein